MDDLEKCTIFNNELYFSIELILDFRDCRVVIKVESWVMKEQVELTRNFSQQQILQFLKPINYLIYKL